MYSAEIAPLFFSSEIPILLELFSKNEKIKVLPQTRLCTSKGLRLTDQEFSLQLQAMLKRHTRKTASIEKAIVVLDIGNPNLLTTYNIDEDYRLATDRREAYCSAVRPTLLYYEHSGKIIHVSYYEPAGDVTFSEQVKSAFENFFNIDINSPDVWFVTHNLKSTDDPLSVIELLAYARQRILGMDVEVLMDEQLQQLAVPLREELIKNFYYARTSMEMFKRGARFFSALYLGNMIFAAAKYTEMLIVMKSGIEGLQSGVLLGSMMKVIGLIAAMPLRSVSILGATAYGVRNYNELSALMQSGFIASGVLSLITMAILASSKYWLEFLFSQPADVASSVGDFSLFYLGSMPAITLSTVAGMIISATNKPLVIAAVNIPTSLVGLGATYVLTYGKLGFDPQGVNGLAISMTLQNWVNLAFYGLYFLCTKNSRHYSVFGGVSASVLCERLKLIFKKGLPFMLESGSEYVYLFIAALYAGILGKNELVQAGVIEQYSFLFAVTGSLAVRQTVIQRVAEIQGRHSLLTKLNTALPIVQENLRSLPRLVRSLCVGLALPFNIMLFTIFVSSYKPLTRLYLDNNESNETDDNFFSEMFRLFVITGLNSSLDFYKNIMGGVLNGLGDIVTPMIISTFLILSCGAGLGAVLGFAAHLGLDGVFASTGIAYFLGLLALLKLVFSAEKILHTGEAQVSTKTILCPMFFNRQNTPVLRQEVEMETAVSIEQRSMPSA